MELADSRYDVFQLPIAEIWIDNTGFNGRDDVTIESVEDLAESIKSKDLDFPVVCQPAHMVPNIPAEFKYRLVCGFRRILACKILDWTHIPAFVREDLPDERSARMTNFRENLERKSLNILEEAKNIDALFPVYRSVRSIAEEISRTDRWVNTRRRLLELSEFVQNAAASGRLTESDVYKIMYSSDPDARAQDILRAAAEGKKAKALSKGRMVRTKADVKKLVTKLLGEGFNPRFLRLLTWVVGEVDDEQLEQTLAWLRDRKTWLR